MTNDIKNGVLFNVASISLSHPRSRSGWDAAVKASERFLSMASMLPNGAYICWQASAETEGSCVAIVFSSVGTNLTAEDYAWTFHGCGEVKPVSASMPEDLFTENRMIYRLAPLEEDREREGGYSSEDRSGCFRELLDMLTAAGATIRFVVQSGWSCRESRGEILLSLPQEMSLRMRTMLALAFPNTNPVRVAAGLPTCWKLPKDVLNSGMAELLCALMQRKRVKADNDALPVTDREPDFCFPEDDDGPFTPLEELELSVRTYNCLKRAGINSVERLRTLSEEDLRKIRSLGIKNIEEIRQKMAEDRPLPKPVLPTTVNYRQMLDGLIGLENVKQQIAKIAAYALLKRDMATLDHASPPVVLNMEFTGNPGTAKTTVARIVAGILHEIGLLPENELIEVGRADLVGKYVGHTADKVKEVFKQARGKVLFIDEAYSLVENQRGDYGDEAINTIVQEMENRREETVVVFAGYPDEMKKFFSRNPGLRSRVPFTIDFSDYSDDELVKIAELEAEKRGFSFSPAAKEKVGSICRIAAQHPELGNGRFSRNLIEDAILGYASRVYGVDASPAAKDFVLTAADFTAPDPAQFASEQMPRIGFCVS